MHLYKYEITNIIEYILIDAPLGTVWLGERRGRELRPVGQCYKSDWWRQTKHNSQPCGSLNLAGVPNSILLMTGRGEQQKSQQTHFLVKPGSLP